MSETNSSPLGDADIGDLGAALAMAGGGGARGLPGGDAGAAQGAGAGGKAPSKSAAPVQSLDFILDIPLRSPASSGRRRLAIRDILQLNQGSVVELSKFAGEPLEVLVNDKLIARGEVVVVNEKFGVRLTDIISPVERIEQLK